MIIRKYLIIIIPVAYLINIELYECLKFNGWTIWFPWSTCSVSCEGKGYSTRRRLCIEKPCEGDNEERVICNSRVRCPLKFSKKTMKINSRKF